MQHLLSHPALHMWAFRMSFSLTSLLRTRSSPSAAHFRACNLLPRRLLFALERQRNADCSVEGEKHKSKQDILWSLLPRLLSKVHELQEMCPQPVIQLILIIHRFHICEFAYWSKFICNPKITTCGAFTDMARVAKNFKSPMCMFPADVEQGEILPSCFSSHTVNKGSFQGLFSAVFFCIFVLFVGGFTVQNSHQVQCLNAVQCSQPQESHNVPFKKKKNCVR